MNTANDIDVSDIETVSRKFIAAERIYRRPIIITLVSSGTVKLSSDGRFSPSIIIRRILDRAKANTYAIAWRLQTARKPDTKEKRMKSILEMMAKGERFHG